MNRYYLYLAIALVTYLISAYYIGVNFLTHDLLGGLMCSIPVIVIGLFIGSAVDGYISSNYPNALYTPYKVLRNLVTERQKKRKELQETMLVKMQYMQGFEHTVTELNKIFTANRKLKLTRWIVFRSWYKEQIDHMLQHPDIYHLTVDGAPYSKEEDPLYDPTAPDWSIYDRQHYYSDEDDEEYDDEDDYDSYGDTRRRNKTTDGIAFGIGLGAWLNIGDNDDNSWDSGSDLA